MSTNPAPGFEAKGRAYLYNFNLRKFRHLATEETKCSARFYWQGICYRCKFPSALQVLVNGQELFRNFALDGAGTGIQLAVSPIVHPGAVLTVKVETIKPRWFRRNTAYVTLEGLELEP